MEANNLSPRARYLMSFVFFAGGLAVVFLAVGIIPSEESEFNAPRWVVGAAGGIFSLAGIMVFVGERWPWVNNIFGLFMVFCFGCIGGWVALYGAADGFSINGNSGLGRIGLFIARFAFGTGSVICFTLVFGTLIHSTIKFFKNRH